MDTQIAIDHNNFEHIKIWKHMKTSSTQRLDKAINEIDKQSVFEFKQSFLSKDFTLEYPS